MQHLVKNIATLHTLSVHKAFKQGQGCTFQRLGPPSFSNTNSSLQFLVYLCFEEQETKAQRADSIHRIALLIKSQD